MAGDGDDATAPIIDTHIDLPDSNRFVRVTVRAVPESEAYPEGIRYRMHYGSYDGTTILRYDNAHPETKGHERHTTDGREAIDFPGWERLLVRFHREVMHHELESTD